MGASVEEITLIKLRENLADIIAEDPKFDDVLYLLMWLRTYKLNLARTEKAIRQSFKWRKENNYQNLVDEKGPPEGTERFMTYEPDVQCKDGKPAAMWDYRRIDFRGAYEALGRDKVTRFFAQMVLKSEARLIEFNKSQNKDVGNDPKKACSAVLSLCTAIHDSKHFEARQATSFALIGVYRDIVGIIVQIPVYNHIIIVNANKWMYYIMKLFRPFIERQGVKLDVFDCSPEIWKPVVFNIFDASDLPQPLGDRPAIK